jgi:hypothetical protein
MSAYNVQVDELQQESPKAPHPCGIKVHLRPHQLALLHRCREFETQNIKLSTFNTITERGSSREGLGENDYMRTQIGIIGDKVGSGKSYVVLALIGSTDSGQLTQMQTRTYGNNRVLISYREPYSNVVPANVLVIPHNLVNQWETYIQNFSDTLRYLVISKQKTLLAFSPNKIETLDLLVVTSTFYNPVANMLSSRSYKLQRVVFDEVDNMNIPNCVHLESRFYWFVTASYGNLLYPRGYSRWDTTMSRYVWNATGLRNSGFVKNLFMDMHNNVSRDFVKILVVKNTDEFVHTSVTLPALDTRIIPCKTPVAIGILSGLVDRQIIECINAGDTNAAIQLINPHNRKTEEGIVAVLIDKLNKQLKYVEARCTALGSLTPEDGGDENQAEINRLHRRAAELQDKIRNITDRVLSGNSCTICFDDVVQKTVVQCCSNTFCFRCISVWISRRPICPLCKQPLDQDKLLVVQEGAEEEEAAAAAQDHAHLAASSSEPSVGNSAVLSATYSRRHDKIHNLEIIMRDRQPGSKFLLFASFETSLVQITSVLHRLNVSHAFLKGNGNQINCMIESYKHGSLDALLINARNYGSGLNLENTSDIIMFHKFDNEVENQVIGRAQRFGRHTPLRVWYLLHDNEHDQMRSRPE